MHHYGALVLFELQAHPPDQSGLWTKSECKQRNI